MSTITPESEAAARAIEAERYAGAEYEYAYATPLAAPRRFHTGPPLCLELTPDGRCGTPTSHPTGVCVFHRYDPPARWER